MKTMNLKNPRRHMKHLFPPAIACPLKCWEYAMHQRGKKHSKNHMNTYMNTTDLIFVKLKAEPDNLYDRNAIAVYIMASSEYKKVGYLASELTQYLHPLLNDPSLGVSVNKIRFCTTFLMIGFYLTLNIIMKGLWEKQFSKVVVKSSRTKIRNSSCFCKTTFSPLFVKHFLKSL